jgi:hypothetical protein
VTMGIQYNEYIKGAKDPKAVLHSYI